MKRELVKHILANFENISFRLACRTFHVSISVYRHIPWRKEDDLLLHQHIVSIAETVQTGASGSYSIVFVWMTL
jgi:hypothetical protein